MRNNSSYKGKRKFDREQLVFVVDTILIGILDRVESSLPSGGIDYAERVRMTERKPRSMTWYEHGAVEAGGMALAVLYAQLSDDGLGIYDALKVADSFDDQIENLVSEAWANRGRAVKAREKAFDKLREQKLKIDPNDQSAYYSISDLYDNWPDTRKAAEVFVDLNWPELSKVQKVA